MVKGNDSITPAPGANEGAAQKIGVQTGVSGFFFSHSSINVMVVAQGRH